MCKPEWKFNFQGNSKFKWPVLSHGTFHYNNQFYTIIVENCKEETINLILGGNQKCIYNPLIELRTSFIADPLLIPLAILIISEAKSKQTSTK